MNTETENNFFVKRLPFVLSLFAVSAFAGYGFNIWLWTNLFLVGVCVLIARQKVFGMDTDVKKDVLSFSLFWLLSTVLGDVVLFSSLVFLPFKKYAEYIIFGLMTVAAFQDFMIIAGRDCVRRIKIFHSFMALSVAVYVFSGLIWSPLETLVIPIMFCLIVAGTIKARKSRDAALLVFTLYFVLLGGMLGMSVDPYQILGVTEMPANKQSAEPSMALSDRCS